MSTSGIPSLPLAAGMLILGAALGVFGTKIVEGAWPDSSTEASGGPGGFGMPVEVEEITAGDVPVIYETLGALRSPQRTVLRPVERGRVTAIHFADGAAVSAGQLLVELDAAHERALLAQATAEHQEAQRLLKQAEALRADNAITEDTLQRRQAKVALAEARLAEAQADLDDHLLHAPFAGTATRADISLGDTVGPEDRIVDLIQTNELRISTVIPERFLAMLHKDIPISITSPALPGYQVDAEVTYIAPEIDPANRSIAIEAKVDNNQGILRHGQSVDVTAVVRTLPNSLAVPEEAVLHRGNRISVFVVVDGTAQARVVELGPRSDGRVIITNGLQAGDQVVVEGHEMLRPGAPVTIINQPEAAPEATGQDQ